MRALVLAGGAGTRLRPLTSTRPKPLVPFVGEPFAAGLLRRLAAAGARDVTFLVAADAAPFDVLAPLGEALGVRVGAYAEEAPLDTAGAARRVLREGHDAPVLVCNGDVLTDLDLAALVAAHTAAGADATIALTRVADTSAYGVVVCDADGRVRRFVEKPPPGTVDADTVNAGTYVLAPGVLDRFPGDGPLSFEREVFPGLVETGAVVRGEVSGACWADLGTPDRYLDGTAAVLEGWCAWPLHPALRLDGTTLVHVDAEVEGDLGPRTVVGAGCVVAARARVADSVLLAGAQVGAGARLRRCIVEEGVAVAPGAAHDGGIITGAGDHHR